MWCRVFWYVGINVSEESAFTTFQPLSILHPEHEDSPPPQKKFPKYVANYSHIPADSSFYSHRHEISDFQTKTTERKIQKTITVCWDPRAEQFEVWLKNNLEHIQPDVLRSILDMTWFIFENICLLSLPVLLIIFTG